MELMNIMYKIRRKIINAKPIIISLLNRSGLKRRIKIKILVGSLMTKIYHLIPTYNQHILDEVLLLLTHHLSHHPVVGHAASHGLKPGQPVGGGGRAVGHVVIVLLFVS